MRVYEFKKYDRICNYIMLSLKIIREVRHPQVVELV